MYTLVNLFTSPLTNAYNYICVRIRRWANARSLKLTAALSPREATLPFADIAYRRHGTLSQADTTVQVMRQCSTPTEIPVGIK